jgi:hypothetical protein
MVTYQQFTPRLQRAATYGTSPAVFSQQNDSSQRKEKHHASVSFSAEKAQYEVSARGVYTYGNVDSAKRFFRGTRWNNIFLLFRRFATGIV